MNDTDRISELEKEIKDRMKELKELTMSDSDRAYASYLASVDNCKDLWGKYVETIKKEGGNLSKIKLAFHRVPLSYLDW
jgi:hypothetical protein